MSGIESALASTFCGGIADTLTKTTISHGGRYRAIVYNYLGVILLLAAGAILLGIPIAFPPELLPAYAVQSVVGAASVAAFFKAYESGKASVLAPLSMLYVLVVLFFGYFVFGELLSLQQLGGASLVLLSAFVLAFEDLRSFRLEKGVLYLLLTVVGWGYYFSFIKLFIPLMGAYMATLALESGVAAVVITYYLTKKKGMTLPNRKESSIIAVRSILIFAATLLYTYAVAGIGVSLTSVIVAGTPLVSVPSAHLILGERMSPHKYAAVLLIVLGLALVLV
ncbi:DMT family transporter [Candidatus Micrarchaeota archaeon]|nr:DMT family transporter [Candidatus Micrarchaeota archaeon]